MSRAYVNVVLSTEGQIQLQYALVRFLYKDLKRQLTQTKTKHKKNKWTKLTQAGVCGVYLKWRAYLQNLLYPLRHVTHLHNLKKNSIM